MRDPVLCISDGYTYERSAIEDWMRRSGSSPMTGQPLRGGALAPNRLAADVLALLAAACHGALLPDS